MTDTTTTTSEAPAAATTAPESTTPLGDALYPQGGQDTTSGGADTTASGADTTAASGADTTSGSDTTAGDATTAGADSLSPASYDSLSLGDDFTVADETMSAFKQLALDNKLDPKAAQSILDLYAKTAQSAATAQHAEFTRVQSEWQKEVRALPEFAADPTAAETTIARVLDEFAGPEVRAILDITGAGNNPHVVSMLLKIGKELGEGSPTPLGAPPKSNGKRTLGQVLYPTPTN